MNKKLTLSLDENIIKLAKIYAEKHNDSISKIVEKFFLLLAYKNNTEIINNESDEISNIIGIIDVPEEIDIKKEYREYKMRKNLND